MKKFNTWGGFLSVHTASEADRIVDELIHQGYRVTHMSIGNSHYRITYERRDLDLSRDEN